MKCICGCHYRHVILMTTASKDSTITYIQTRSSHTASKSKCIMYETYLEMNFLHTLDFNHLTLSPVLKSKIVAQSIWYDQMCDVKYVSYFLKSVYFYFILENSWSIVIVSSVYIFIIPYILVQNITVDTKLLMLCMSVKSINLLELLFHHHHFHPTCNIHVHIYIQFIYVLLQLWCV
jgi:hypothetical protein